MYYIYEIYNDVTQKKYIGLTGNLKNRMYEHFNRLQKGTHTAEGIVEDAIKYGLSHFSYKIIDLAETKEEGHQKEAKYMRKFNSYVPEYGYNGNDNRFKKRYHPVMKRPDTELTRRIFKQGYTLNHFPWELGISYREFLVKLNNPEMFTNEELKKLNDCLSLNVYERHLQYEREWKERFKREG